jgi:hypothetical protein
MNPFHLPAAFALALGLVSAAPSAGARSVAPSRPAADLADRVLDALGGRGAWDGTHYISWNFRGKRKHLWDKWSGNLRFESGDRLCLLNLGTREGRVFEKGVEVTDAAAKKTAIDQTCSAFINDSYWMFMPYKLKDPGVHRSEVGERKTKEGKDAEVLELTFDDVGETPRNRYLVYVGKESGLVEQWEYFPDRDDREPKISTPWKGWKRFGKILLCTDHGDGNDWSIAAYDKVPDSAFHDPAPPKLP